MTVRNKQSFRGVAAPARAREPVLVRLCSAFVSNLSTILQAGLVVGAAFFIHDFRILMDELLPAATVSEAIPVAVEIEVQAAAEPELQESLYTDRVMHFYNCTFEDYRNANYEDCVLEPSEIYQPPEADPDDTGRFTRGSAPVKYAREVRTRDDELHVFANQRMQFGVHGGDYTTPMQALLQEFQASQITRIP